MEQRKFSMGGGGEAVRRWHERILKKDYDEMESRLWRRVARVRVGCAKTTRKTRRNGCEVEGGETEKFPSATIFSDDGVGRFGIDAVAADTRGTAAAAGRIVGTGDERKTRANLEHNGLAR